MDHVRPGNDVSSVAGGGDPPASLLLSWPATTTTQSLWMVMDIAVLAKLATLAMEMTRM